MSPGCGILFPEKREGVFGMSVTAAVRMALTKGGKKQAELARAMGIHRQSMYLKMVKERWTGAELAKVAEFTGGKLVFLYPDGQQIPIEAAEQQAGE